MGREETEPGWIATAAGVCYPIDSRKELGPLTVEHLLYEYP